MGMSEHLLLEMISQSLKDTQDKASEEEWGSRWGGDNNGPDQGNRKQTLDVVLCSRKSQYLLVLHSGASPHLLLVPSEAANMMGERHRAWKGKTKESSWRHHPTPTGLQKMEREWINGIWLVRKTET